MRDRTADLLRAKQALSQLSYSPSKCLGSDHNPSRDASKSVLTEARTIDVCTQHTRECSTTGSADLVGLGRFELPTSPLSGVRSNQLSYRPSVTCSICAWPHYLDRTLGHILRYAPSTSHKMPCQPHIALRYSHRQPSQWYLLQNIRPGHKARDYCRINQSDEDKCVST